MKTRFSKRRKLREEATHLSAGGDEAISNLPDAVLHRILSLLPINSIAQTALLSKRWRDLWSSIPDLDFTTLPPKDSQNLGFLLRILAHRDRTSGLRSLKLRHPLTFSQLNALIRRAVAHRIQELYISIATDDTFTLPRCLFAADSLRILRLASYISGFRLPPQPLMPWFFGSLRILSLTFAVFDETPSLTDASFPVLQQLTLVSCSGLKQLVIGCRALEDVSVGDCFGLRDLRISGPRLERLRVVRCFETDGGWSLVKMDCPRLMNLFWESNSITEETCLENLGAIHEASIDFFSHSEAPLSPSELRSVSSFLSGLSHAHRLSLDYRFAEVLSNAEASRTYLGGFECRELFIRISKENISGLGHVFESFPMVENLKIMIAALDYKTDKRERVAGKYGWGCEEERLWESPSQQLTSFLRHLKVVKYVGALELDGELGPPKLLLRHGGGLREMILCCGHFCAKRYRRRQKVVADLKGFSWASPDATISFCEPSCVFTRWGSS